MDEQERKANWPVVLGLLFGVPVGCLAGTYLKDKYDPVISKVVVEKFEDTRKPDFVFTIGDTEEDWEPDDVTVYTFVANDGSYVTVGRTAYLATKVGGSYASRDWENEQ